jgi:hypothetical protein
MLALLLRGGQLGNDILGRERFDLPLELQRMAICHPQSIWQLGGAGGAFAEVLHRELLRISYVAFAEFVWSFYRVGM